MPTTSGRRRPPAAAKLAITTYAGLTYAFFLTVLGYAVGFFANTGVPTSIDGRSGGRGLTAWAVDLLLLAAFALQHSVMARPRFKRAWTRIVPVAAERSTYVLAASVVLALLMTCWQPVGPSVYRVAGPAALALRTVQACGWIVVIGSTFLVSHTDLFGLRQAWTRARGARYQPLPFVERGLYRLVRHPLMTGFLIVFWATPHLTVGHLVFAGLASAYIGAGIVLEERDLSRAFGPAYDDYRSRTPAVIPLPLVRSRVSP